MTDKKRDYPQIMTDKLSALKVGDIICAKWTGLRWWGKIQREDRAYYSHPRPSTCAWSFKYDPELEDVRKASPLEVLLFWREPAGEE
jgi:hypothetical protein